MTNQSNNLVALKKVIAICEDGFNVSIDSNLFRSDAWISLKGKWTSKVLMEFYCRRQMQKVNKKSKRWEIINNGEIVFPYRDAQKRFKNENGNSISTSTFARALDELVEKGFIDIKYSGGGMEGDISKYSISDRWKKYGTPEFVKKSRTKDTRKLGFKKKNESH